MTRSRTLAALLLLLVVAPPVLLPLFDLFVSPAAWGAWRETGRLLDLAGWTLLFSALTLAIVFPLGVPLAVLLYRSDLPGRHFFRGLILLTLFVPLPLFASAWQAALGTGGWLHAAAERFGLSEAGVWRPWNRGVGPAAWTHAMAALPWVVWLVGQGLCWVEPELEEDALTAAPAWRVLWRVTLPRARPALAVAALWVVVQAATEITVTDAMLVPTFAEEVYTQFVGGEGLEGAVAVSLPWALLTGVLALAVVRRWERGTPPLLSAPDARPLLRLGAGESMPSATPLPSPAEEGSDGGRLAPRVGSGSLGEPAILSPQGGREAIQSARVPSLSRCLWFVAVAVLLALWAGVPLASLLWKAGGGGLPAGWSAATFGAELVLAFRGQSGLVLDSLLWSAVAGVLAAGLALLACWAAVGSRPLRVLLVALAVLAWVLPGPVLGFGLREAIDRLLDLEDWLLGSLPWRPLRAVLYDGPSPLPVLWVSVARLFPYAVAVLWPAVRLVPGELLDAARVDGATPLQEVRLVVWPLTRAVFVRAALAVAVLALGEISASKIVQVPGRQTFAQELFNQMHYGTSPTLASLCLIQLLLTGAGVGLLMWSVLSGGRRLS